jgi:glycosyltransferase involved in cell wall biosynthesis
MENRSPHKRAVVFGSYIFSLINFRKQLLCDLVANGYEVLAIAPGNDAEIVDALKKIGVSFRSIPLSRTGFNPLRDLRTIVELSRLFKQFRPTLLITYTIKPVIYGNLVASFSPATKKLALITGLGYLDTGAKTLRKRVIQSLIYNLYRVSLRNLEYIAFQNPDDKKYFEDFRLINETTKRTVTAGSGVDLSHYSLATPVLTPVTFILIARLIKAKGILEYIDAARALKKEFGSRACFQLIGLMDTGNPDSIDEGALSNAVDEGVIDYKGFQKDVRTFLSAASVFVLPSFYREGTPRTALESMAMGKPIVTTDNPGCRETVSDRVNGFLVPVRDSAALASAMRKFIVDPTLIEHMGRESYKLARNKFDVHLVNKHLFEFASL